MAILNELPSESGEVITNGKIGYVSEESWIFSDTVRENILFGMEMSPTWYSKVIHACALEKVKCKIDHVLRFWMHHFLEKNLIWYVYQETNDRDIYYSFNKKVYSTPTPMVKLIYELGNASKNNYYDGIC